MGCRRGQGSGAAPGLHVAPRLPRDSSSPKSGQVIDPAHQLKHDQRDDADRDDKEDDPSLVTIGTCLQHHDTDDTVEERADESGQHVLGHGILDEELRGTRRHIAGGRTISRCHRAQRERRHRQHAGGDNIENGIDRLRIDGARNVEGYEALRDGGENRRQDADRANRRRAHPQAPAELSQYKSPAPEYTLISHVGVSSAREGGLHPVNDELNRKCRQQHAE